MAPTQIRTDDAAPAVTQARAMALAALRLPGSRTWQGQPPDGTGSAARA